MKLLTKAKMVKDVRSRMDPILVEDPYSNRLDKMVGSNANHVKLDEWLERDGNDLALFKGLVGHESHRHE